VALYPAGIRGDGGGFSGDVGNRIKRERDACREEREFERG
jgi:hypothetical protein